MLGSYDLWEVVKNSYTTYEETDRLTAAQRIELEEKIKKDAKALSMIQQGVDDSVFPQIMGAETSKEAWNVLQKEFQGSNQAIAVKVQALRRDFENLTMKNT